MKKRLFTLFLTFVMMSGINLPVKAGGEINLDFSNVLSVAGEQPSTRISASDKATFLGGTIMTFEINAPKAGEYWFGGNIINIESTSGYIGISLDDGKTYQEVNIKQTLGYQDFFKLNLVAGTNKLMIRYRNSTDMWLGLQVSGFVFEKTKQAKNPVKFNEEQKVYKAYVAPANIQAEDYDYDGYFSRDGVNVPVLYRPNDCIDIYEGGTGYFIELLNPEYVTYTFNVKKKGIYSFELYHAGMGEVDVYIDDATYPMSVDLGNFNPEMIFDNTYVASVELSAGEHKIKLLAKNALVRIDYIKVRNSEKTETPIDIYNNNGARYRINKNISYYSDTEKKINPVYKEFYVSSKGSDDSAGTKEKPFLTIQKAVSVIRPFLSSMEGDIIINIEDGEYSFKNALKLDNVKGRNGYNVVFKGYGEEKPVISGGVKVENWKKLDSGIYKASYKHNSDIVNGMYINTYPAVLAQTKYHYRTQGYYDDPTTSTPYDGVIFEKRNFPTFSNVTDNAYMKYIYEWAQSRLKIEDVKELDNNMVAVCFNPESSMVRGVIQGGYCSIKEEASYLWFENQKSFLDEPGEFWYDNKAYELYYLPFAEEDMKTAEVYVPLSEALIEINGENTGNIVFENISFRYNDRPKLPENISPFQAGIYHTDDKNDIRVTAAFRIEDTESIKITDCEFAAMTSAGISVDRSDYIEINGNIFRDLGESSVEIGELSNKEKNISHDILFTNNYIRRVGYFNKAVTGADFYSVQSTKILYNDIRDVPYSGMTMAWEWGSAGRLSSNNEIAYNRVENTMRVTNDGGGIYTVGSMKGSSTHDNYISNCSGCALYNDSGSSFNDVYDNVVDRAGRAIHADPSKNVAQYVFNNFTNSAIPYRVKAEAAIWENNYICVGAWPREALDIMENAGVRDEYKKNESLTIYPLWRTDFAGYVPSCTFAGRNTIRAAADANRAFVSSGYSAMYHATEGVGNTRQNDWWEYDFTILESGEYDIMFTYINANEDYETVAGVTIDGEYKDVPLPGAETWQEKLTENLGKYYLEKGKHTIKIEIVSESNFGPENLLVSDGKTYTENDEWYDEGVIGERHYPIDVLERLSPVFENITKIDNEWGNYWVIENEKNK